MEKASDDESLEDAPPDDASQEGSEFVEMDPSGRYGRYKEMLGKGAYKTVYKAFDDLDGIEVAWNQVKIHDVLHHAGDIERLYSELHLLKTLKHKNIIKFYTSWVDMRNRNVNFITEIFTSGTLRHYRKKHQHVKLRAIKNWSRQILRGLVFLHSRDPPIIHRDLKCDNIFINGNTGEVKIGDLGLATILRQAPAAQSVIGTPEFMAPELYEEHYNELVDVYSFGMCLLEMLTSEYPYSECTNAAQIYKKVTTGKKPAALGKIKDHETREFVEKCLTSASQRLHARELLMDPFLLNDEDLEVQETKICGSSNFRRGSLHGLDPIPENPYVSSADCYDKLRKKSCSTSEGFSRVDTCYERIALSDSSSPKEETKICLDFRIKGRKQDDKKVLVRIRIANSGGEVRIIQFDFDVDADTAMSVASEMVAELDLSDQDVTVIAEMIDAEIMALIPDWKPGLALDDTVDDDAGKEPKGPMIEATSMQDESDGLLISAPAPGMAVDTSDDSQLASNPTYGRFEEVGCNVISLDQQEQDSDGLELFSDFSADAGSDSSLDAQLSSESGADNGLSAHNLEVIETKMKLGSLPSSGEGQPGVNDVKNEEECTIIVSDDLPSSGEGQPGINDGNNEEECSIVVSDEKLDDTEVGRLIMQQQEELQILQTRHEEALSYLRTRLSQEGMRIGDKPLPTEHLTCAISEGVFQLSGKEDDSHIYAASEVCLRTAEEACSSVSIFNDPPAAIDKSKGVSFASIAPLEIALTDSASIADNVKGSHDIISAESTATMPKRCLNEKDDACGEGDSFVGKGNDVAKDKINREPDSIAVAGLAETRTNALYKSAQASKAPAETAISVKRSTPLINEDGKLSFPTIMRRESYLELYKASNSKDKSFSPKPSESPSTADGASKIVSKDANQEQLKKMADFADRLINNLTQGNSKYLGTSVKNPQNGQQGGSVKSHGGTSIQGGQHPAVTKSVSGAVVPNGQLSSGVKNITGVSNQNLQQGSLGKNRTISVVQTSSVEKLSNAVTLNGQQDASMKAVQVSQSGATGKSFPGANAHNGQQSGLSLNQTNASTHTTNQGAASGCLTTTFQKSASAKGLTSGNS